MQLEDYLIDPTSYNWNAIVKTWKWLLPETFEIWLVNRFGDLFMVLADGSVHWLQTDSGNLVMLAASEKDFEFLIRQGDNFNQWFLASLVDHLVAHQITLAPGQCYGYIALPRLGGAYDLNNIRPISMAEYLSFLGKIYDQLRHYPDGTNVEIKIIP